ncbi:MAG: resolvase [Sulfobacillus acidophilus]|uniref:Resolvase n=2 Tax=Sulfobacillus acidophilus TaxID=53633 RepID=A0A2T2WDH5_9FIRM|nr:MAG: resolvase [Sulfobacillus acidophilus]
MDEQFVSIGKAAKMLGMSIEGLRKWEREGRLIPVRTLTNHRRYRVADLHALMHEDVENPALDTRCILYARVSTKKQQDAGNLDRQLGRLTAFAAEQHWTVVAALTDVASGLNEQRRGLHQLLDLARDHQASLVVVESRDRLARFGWGYLETFLHAFGVRLIVMESSVTDDQPELVEDLIAITTSFSARIYGKGGGKKMGATVRQAMATLAQEGVSE